MPRIKNDFESKLIRVPLPCVKQVDSIIKEFRAEQLRIRKLQRAESQRKERLEKAKKQAAEAQAVIEQLQKKFNEE